MPVTIGRVRRLAITVERMYPRPLTLRDELAVTLARYALDLPVPAVPPELFRRSPARRGHIEMYDVVENRWRRIVLADLQITEV